MIENLSEPEVAELGDLPKEKEGVHEETSGGEGFREEESLKSKAEKVAQRVTEEIRDESLRRVKRFLNEQKDNLADHLERASDVLHQGSKGFQEKEQITVSHWVDKMAQKTDGYTSYLRGKNLEEIAEEVRSVARKNPSLFLLSAFTVGVAMSRFLRSSGTRNPESMDRV